MEEYLAVELPIYVISKNRQRATFPLWTYTPNLDPEFEIEQELIVPSSVLYKQEGLGADL